MMKFKSAILPIILLGYGTSTLGMQQQNPPVTNAAPATSTPNKITQTNQNSRGWLESWLPSTFDNADRSIQALEKITAEGVALKHEIKVKHEMFGDQNTVDTLNKTGTSLVKTCLTAGIGGAIALAGVILLYNTLMSQNTTNYQEKDTRPLYKRIVTNRYLISALLIATGTGIILKSDKIVAAVS